MRAVFDTNVYVAAFLRRSLSDAIFRCGRRGNLELYSSKAIIEELGATLRRKLRVPEPAIQAYIRIVGRSATVVTPAAPGKLPVAFQGDEHVAACCLAAKAHLLVTLDRRLLRQKRLGDTAIVHPRAVLWILGRTATDERKAA